MRPLVHALRAASLLLVLLTFGASALARGPDDDHDRDRGDDDGAWPQVECLSAYGKTVCGYACVAAYAEIKCAAVPWGACHAAYGQIVCGPDDAPRRARRWRHIAKASCLAASGRIACGYGCVAGYGDVQCAATPSGRCEAAYGKITCAAGGGGRAPQTECKSAYGKTACGYSCVAAYGDVQCASRPNGRCVAAHGQITCSD